MVALYSPKIPSTIRVTFDLWIQQGPFVYRTLSDNQQPVMPRSSGFFREWRQGGIWVVIEYNGDEADGVALRKAGLEAHMRDAYDAFFNAGCDELTQVDIGARLVVTGAGVIGPMAQTLAVVYKTRLKIEDADGVDWANKDSIDFNQVWDELLLNTRWRNELRGD